MAPAAALALGAGIAAVGNIISNKMRADAQSSAADRLADASREGLEAYRNAYGQSYGKGSYNDQTQRMGLEAAKVYQDMLNNPELWNEFLTGEHAYHAPETFSFNAEDLYNDPSYAWRLKQGQDALSQTQVAGGLNLSGAAAKQMNDWTQNEASKEYAAAYKRANDQYNTDRQFDFNKWLTDANRYYQNITAQLNGQNNLMNKGVQANNAQAVAMQGLAGNTADSAAQVASALNSGSNAQSGFLADTNSTLANIGGAMITSMAGQQGNTPTSSGGSSGSYDFSGYNPYSIPVNQDNATLFMNGYNPYLGSNMG